MSDYEFMFIALEVFILLALDDVGTDGIYPSINRKDIMTSKDLCRMWENLSYK